MNKSHKHATLIRAWADGAEIEWESPDRGWVSIASPSFIDSEVYRIKPEPKPDVVLFVSIFKPCPNPGVGGYLSATSSASSARASTDNLKLTFCGASGKLVKAEVVL